MGARCNATIKLPLRPRLRTHSCTFGKATKHCAAQAMAARPVNFRLLV